MSMLTILSGLFAGLLARDSASSPPTPPPAPPAQPQFDARALYEALIGMNGGEPTDSTPFKLYTTRPLTGADAARLLEPAKPPPGVVPEGFALDAINNPMDLWGASGTITEGMFWLGFPYLAELAQRTEYRRISETIAKDMTRRWFRLQATGEDDKTDKIKALEELMKFHKLQEKFTLLALLDGFFGRGHLYIDTGQTDDTQLLKLPLPIDPRTIRKGSLKGIRVIEPMWAYPHMYNANDPLRENFYLPQSWWVMGKEIHRTRLLPFIGREMPDMLKPAYSFAGLSLSQMAKPYVDNWLRTRQSVSDLIHSFSTPVMMTNMGSVLNAGASAQLKMRAALFNYLRDNNNLMVLDKTTEDFKNVSAPLGALDHLQAQSQEHMASAVGIPLVVLLGISPSGLNATSEGELQVWAQFIHAAQGSFFDAHLTTILNVMQLHLFGEIDPSITHAWEPLRELSEEEEKTAEKTQADIDAVYVNAGVLSPDEIRQRLSGEADSPYQGLDLDTPAPPPPQQEQDPMGGGGGAPDPLGGGAGGGAGGPGGPPGAGGAAPHGMGTSAPAGGSAGAVSSGPGKVGSAGGSAAAPNPNKGSKDEEAVPELDETGMPVEKNRGHTRIATQDPDAEIHVHLGQNDRAHVKLGADSVGVVMGMDALDAYNPNEPRGQPQNAGQWTAGGGGGSYVQAGEAGEAGGRKAGRSTIHFHADPGQKLGQQSSGEGIGMKSLAGRALHSFGKEDYEILHKFTDSPPEQRQNIATRSVQFAKALPRMVLNAGIEEKNNVVHTAGALRSMLTGKGPSPEQWRGLRNIGLTALMVGVPMLLGDPLSAAEAVHHAGGELMNHVLIEHAAKMAIGVGLTTAALRRRKKTAAAPAHDADPAAGAGPSPDDIAMVQKFLMQLSKSVMTMDGPTAQQMLEQDEGAQDEFDALDAFDPNEQRDASGRWGSGGGHIQYNLPPAPGTADIPEGHIRLYHQTDEKNLGAIKHQGIQMSKAMGTEGPKGIYADPKGFYGAPATTPTVEFHVPKAQYDGPFVRAQSVDPAQILAVHHPWHAIARSLEGNQGAIQAILSGKRDRLINDPTYGKAIRYIKHKFGGQASDEWNESDHPRGQPGNAGQFGPGGGGGSARKAEGIASRAKGEATETRSGGSSAARRQQRYAKARNEIDNLLYQPIDLSDLSTARQNPLIAPGRRLEEFNKIADITAKAFDFSRYRGSISFSDEKKTFALNGKEYEYAGAAYITGQRKGDIVIYTNATTLGGAAKVMAHEIGHEQTQYVLDVLQDEKEQIYQLEKTEGINAVRNAMDMLRPEYREKFPLYDRINHVFDTRLLSEEDGITDYSREWWQAFKDGKCDAMTAMHETLAEMSMLEYEGSLSRLLWYKESKAYRPLYEAVRDYAKQTT
jgi:phage-related protein (TIGR01555 family)